MKHKSYHSYIRNNWPLPFVEPWLYGPTMLAKPPFRYDYILCTRLNDKSGWHYYAKDLLERGHKIDLYLSKPKNLLIFKKEAATRKKENLVFSLKVYKINFQRLDIPQLTELLKKWHFIYSKFCAAYMPIDATDETLEINIRHAIAKTKINLSLPDIACLLTPNDKSYVGKEHENFCQLLAKRRTKNFSILCQRHIDKWWWVPMGWGQHQPMTLNSLMQKINKSNPKKTLGKQRDDDNYRQKILRRKNEIIKSLPRSVTNLLNAFEVLAEMHDSRKEIQMKMLSAGFLITEAILKKSCLPLKFRDYILINEYFNIKNGIEVSVVKTRQKAFWCEAKSSGQVECFSGNAARRKLNASGIYKKTKEKTDIIHGSPASPGKVLGKIRLGFDSKILSRTFKAGEILVTGQTTPDFIAIMKKANAIITDEGGITSHAAVVSRELGIPCVVGTKIATKVLKNRDLVEVDADKGIIKKL